MKKLNIIFAGIAILFFAGSGWGACRSGSYSLWLEQTYSCGCTSSPSCKGLGLCDSHSSGTLVDCRIGDVTKCQEGTYCGFYTISSISCSMACDTESEADSVQCILDGNTWQAGICKINHCKAADSTWLSTSIAACTGSNNYALVNTDSTCEHVGTCCPNDSIPSGNTCKWRCDSLYTACTAKNGYLYAGVLQDTTLSGGDTSFISKCYWTCSYAYSNDSTNAVTEGNAMCLGPSTPISDCIKGVSDYTAIRTTYGDSVYSYDFLTPGSAAYIDSIVLTPCERSMWRCTIDGKYRYWYSDSEIPAGCTNIVKIK